ncbi:outer membrane protein assembly factor BamB [Gammaproteobacteria bacterium AS21]
MNIKRIIAIASTALFIAGCSSNGEEIEPSPLVKINAENKVNVLWSKDIGSSFGDKYHQLTPGVVGKSIIVTDTQGQVSSYDLDTGKSLWKTDLDVAISSGVGAGAGTAVVTTYTGDVIALSSIDGAIKWQVPIDGEVVAQPQMNSDIVVVQMVTGNIIALDINSGEQRWVFTSNQPNLTLRGTSSPLVALDATLTGLDNGKFVALDNKSGNILWQERISVPSGKSDIERLTDIDGKPMLYQNVIYIPSYNGNLTAINPFNAQVLWRKPYSTYRGLAGGNGNVYLSSSNDIVHGLDARSAAEIWRQDLLLNRTLTSPVSVNNTVAVGDKEGYVHFLAQNDGRFVARYKIGSALIGDMLVKDDVLYVLSNNGRLSALSIK